MPRGEQICFTYSTLFSVIMYTIGKWVTQVSENIKLATFKGCGGVTMMQGGFVVSIMALLCQL